MDEEKFQSSEFIKSLKNVLKTLKTINSKTSEQSAIALKLSFQEFTAVLKRFGYNCQNKRGNKKIENELKLKDYFGKLIEEKEFNDTIINISKECSKIVSNLAIRLEANPEKLTLELCQNLCFVVSSLIEAHEKLKEDEKKNLDKEMKNVIKLGHNMNDLLEVILSLEERVDSDVTQRILEKTQNSFIELCLKFFNSGIKQKGEFVKLAVPTMLARLRKSLVEEEGQKKQEYAVNKLCDFSSAIEYFEPHLPGYDHIALYYNCCFYFKDNKLLTSKKGKVFLSQYITRLCVINMEIEDTESEMQNYFEDWCTIFLGQIYALVDSDLSKSEKETLLRYYADILIESYVQLGQFNEGEDFDFTEDIIVFFKKIAKYGMELQNEKLRKGFLCLLQEVHAIRSEATLREKSTVHLAILVEEMYKDLLFSNCSCPNWKIRLNSLEVFASAFIVIPTKPEYMEKQYQLLSESLFDPVPEVRIKTIQITSMVLRSWGALIPQQWFNSFRLSLIKLSTDNAPSVRQAVVLEIDNLLAQVEDNLELVKLVKSFLEKMDLEDLFCDSSQAVRKAAFSLALNIQKCPLLKTEQYIPNKLVLQQLCVDGLKSSKLGLLLTQILIPVYFIRGNSKKEKLSAFVSLFNEDSLAALYFFKYLPLDKTISLKDVKKIVSLLCKFVLKSFDQRLFNVIQLKRVLLSIAFLWSFVHENDRLGDSREELKKKFNFNTLIKPLLRYCSDESFTEDDVQDLKARIVELAAFGDMNEKLVKKIVYNFFIANQTSFYKRRDANGKRIPPSTWDQIHSACQKSLGAELHCMKVWGQEKVLLEEIVRTLRHHLGKENYKENGSTQEIMSLSVSLWCLNYLLDRKTNEVVVMKNVSDFLLQFIQELLTVTTAVGSKQKKARKKKLSPAQLENPISVLSICLECYAKLEISLSLYSNLKKPPNSLFKLVVDIFSDNIFLKGVAFLPCRLVILAAVYDYLNILTSASNRVELKPVLNTLEELDVDDNSVSSCSEYPAEMFECEYILTSRIKSLIKV
eukprot:snap_masked-scaffold_2-processed-gene-10.29-mRNA-1 protein AED:1.00 eAED:1.00 QI:0/-1/0/0/-1/1/1/0/1027